MVQFFTDMQSFVVFLVVCFDMVPPCVFSLKSLFSKVIYLDLPSTEFLPSLLFVGDCKVFIKSLSFVNVVGANRIGIMHLGWIDVPDEASYSLFKPFVFYFLFVFHGSLKYLLNLTYSIFSCPWSNWVEFIRVGFHYELFKVIFEINHLISRHSLTELPITMKKAVSELDPPGILEQQK